MCSGSRDDHRGQWRDGWVRCGDPQPIAEVVPERQAKLLAGLHKAQHNVARMPAVTTDCAARYLALDHKATQISFRCVCIERRFRSLQNAQQFHLAAFQPRQQFIEIAIAGADREYPVEPDPKCTCCALAGFSLVVFEKLVKEPDELAQGFDLLNLPGRRRHQLVQQAFRMDPAERMGADPELSGIVGDDHRIADQTMMANGTPDTGLGKRTNDVPVENVDAMFGQMLKKRNLIGKALRFLPLQRLQKNRVHLPVFQKGEGGIVENVVLIIAAQQSQVQPRLRWRRSKGGEIFAADMRRMKIAVGMPGTGIVDSHIGRGNQAGMQDGSILGMKTVQILCQKPDDLAFGNLHTDIVEQGRQSLRRNLSMAVKRQAEASQIGPKATLDASGQRRDDHAPVRGHCSGPLNPRTGSPTC